MVTPTPEQLESAYWNGWNDGYEDQMYDNPFDSLAERELWERYDLGYWDGSDES